MGVEIMPTHTVYTIMLTVSWGGGVRVAKRNVVGHGCQDGIPKVQHGIAGIPVVVQLTQAGHFQGQSGSL